jgi:hypothetical protein
MEHGARTCDNARNLVAFGGFIQVWQGQGVLIRIPYSILSQNQLTLGAGQQPRAPSRLNSEKRARDDSPSADPAPNVPAIGPQV